MRLDGQAGELGRHCEIQEVNLLLRFAMQALTKVERQAVEAFLRGWSDREAGEIMDLTASGVWTARNRAFGKMRKALQRLGVQGSSSLLSERTEQTVLK